MNEHHVDYQVLPFPRERKAQTGEALLGLTTSALGIFGLLVPAQWWPTLAVVSSIVSLIGLMLFWNAFRGTLNKVGAIGVDVAALIALLWANWPSADMVGA